MRMYLLNLREWIRHLPFRFLLIGFIALLVVSAFTVSVTPLPSKLLSGKTPETLKVLDRDGGVLAIVPQEGARAAESVPLSQMGEWLPVVTVALEDHRYYSHRGIDIYALVAATCRNILAGRVTSGASTLTQQLIKQASSRRGRSLQSKIYENLAALKLEFYLSKDEMLEAYLNRADYGNRRVGPVAASKAYFDKTPSDLDLNEAIWLAGIPQAPGRFNSWTSYEQCLKKYRRSVNRLFDLKIINLKDKTSLLLNPPEILRNIPESKAPHFVQMVSGFYFDEVVSTSLDIKLQGFCEKVVEQHLETLIGRKASQAAVVVLDNQSGEVRALVGSGDFFGPEGQINGAMIRRSPGSTLKPFVYLRGIEKKVFTAATLLPDTPDTICSIYGDYDPRNYDKRFWGAVRIREALGSSLNVPAVVALSRVGARDTYHYMNDFGLDFEKPLGAYGAGLILGNAPVRLLDLAAAYASIANRGRAIEWSLVSGAQPSRKPLADAASVEVLIDMLSDPDARVKTFGTNSPLNTKERVAVKTGTSSNFCDAWAVGFTQQHTVAVWMGNFNNQPMDEVASVRGPAPIWRTIIDRLLESDSPVEFMDSERLEMREVCSVTGLLPSVESSTTVNEFFIKETAPKDSANEMLIQDEDGVTLRLPVEYQMWCASPFNWLGAEVEEKAPLRIFQPAKDSVYVIDQDLPKERQLLELVGSAGPQSIWRVNGKEVLALEGKFMWQLERGSHLIEVEANGERISHYFEVE